MSTIRQLTVMVADDEPLAREYIATLIDQLPNVELLGVFANGRELIQACQSELPDLLILDIEMPGLSGFDVVEALQADDMPGVIFATAYDNFAIDAFDMNAVDYLLKPFDADRFSVAMNRGLAQLPADLSLKGRLISASRQIQNAPDSAEVDDAAVAGGRIAVRDGRDIDLVAIDDIDWIDAAGDYMCLHVSGKTHIMRSTMKDLLEKLPSADFARIHRSTIVNLRRVTSVSSLSKGEFRLHLGDQTSLKVSRNYRQSILSLLK